MNEKIWVVASLGLVGQEMVQYLKENGAEYVATTHLEADITDLEALKAFYAREKPTHIINCSAIAHVDHAENERRQLAYDVNVTGVANLAKVAAENRVKFVHISTDYVFDGEKETDYTEGDPVAPVNYYGKTKLEGEQKLLEICEDSVCVRTASVYGAKKAGLIAGIIHMLETKVEAKGIIDQISAPTYAKHLVKALWDLRNEKGIFHFVNSGIASRFDLVEEIRDIAEEKGRPLKCNRVIGVTSEEFGRAAVRPKRSVLNTHKIEQILNWPIPAWQAALREYLKEIGWVV